MAEISIKDGVKVLVDDQDLALVAGYRWRLNHYGYVVAYRDNECIYIHRLILGAKPGEEVDHEHHNKLDNRRSELRLVTKAQNGQNSIVSTRRKRSSVKSQYKGVFWFRRDGKWAAQICLNGKSTHLGYFDDEVEAAKAYNQAAIKHFGPFSCVNLGI